MRIADISSSYTMVTGLTNLKSSQNNLSQQLITGKSVDELQDDSSLARSLLNSQVTREKLVQQNNNITLCDNIASASSDSLDYIDKEIDLAITVSESAQTVTQDDSNSISDYASKIDDILGEVLSMANTKYGDDYLFAGDASGSSVKPYSYVSPMSDEISSITTIANSGATGTTAADNVQTQIDSALTEANATDSFGDTFYGGTFSLNAAGDGYTFSGTATDGSNAVLSTLNSMLAVKDAVSSGTGVSSAVSSLSTAAATVRNYDHYVYNGSGDGREIQVSDGISISPFSTEDGNKAIRDTLNSLLAVSKAIRSADKDTISAATESLSKAQDSIVDAQGDISSKQSRLGLLSDRNSSAYTHLDDAEETATNASEEETTVKLLAAQQAYSAALQGTSLLLGQSLLDFM